MSVFNFNQISENLLTAKVDKVENINSQVLIYSALINLLAIDKIDFDKLNADEIIEAHDSLFEIISDEDEDGNILLDPNHPFSQLNSIQYKIIGLVGTQMERVPSPFLFL